MVISSKIKAKYFRSCIAVLISFGLVSGLTSLVRAETAETAPQELKDIILDLEAAANNKNLEGVMQYYSPEFTNTDGLTQGLLAQALTKLWQQYPQLQYKTEIESWQRDGNQIVAQTLTKITGSHQERSKTTVINSVLRSRQHFQAGKLVNQEVLTEETTITSGDNPPQVEVLVPEKVQSGDKYNFDVIVKEPLGDKVLLGAVKEERTSSSAYLNSGTLELEPLAAGGIFKVVTAPLLSDRTWLSAILVRGDGITVINRRVTIEERAEKQP